MSLAFFLGAPVSFARYVVRMRMVMMQDRRMPARNHCLAATQLRIRATPSNTLEAGGQTPHRWADICPPAYFGAPTLRPRIPSQGSGGGGGPPAARAPHIPPPSLSSPLPYPLLPLLSRPPPPSAIVRWTARHRRIARGRRVLRNHIRAQWGAYRAAKAPG